MGGLSDCRIIYTTLFFTEPVSVIANRYQMSANNVMVILSRTRKKLKAHLEKEGLYEKDRFIS